MPCRLAMIVVILWASAAMAESLSERIDRECAAGWQAAKVTPAASCDDATFLRRVTLDLAGRIPTSAEVRRFLEDKTATKRTKIITELLLSPSYAKHWATFWRREWLPQTDVPNNTLSEEFEAWLTVALRDNVRYERIVHELLTAPRGPAMGFIRANDYQPESLAANTTRAFLGVNLDCAQCHNHPFARWTRAQFWETAAFFTRPTPKEKPVRFELQIPNTTTTLAAKLLTDPQPTWPGELANDSGRLVFANWVTAKENPYFAKNAVNRVWANLFGTGLVEPLDDLSGDNPASHPALLDLLAESFMASGYDLRQLLASITQTKTYQLASTTAGTTPRLFANAAVRGLTGEQLYDSLRMAAGYAAERVDLDPSNALRERQKFAAKFRVERTGNAQRSILQALSLMNGTLINELTSFEKAPVLRALATSPFLDTNEKVTTLFYATFGRPPSADERAPLVQYVEKGDNAKALANIFWAMLNSSEFNTNH